VLSRGAQGLPGEREESGGKESGSSVPRGAEKRLEEPVTQRELGSWTLPKRHWGAIEVLEGRSDHKV
jgi:hypothetical protein